MDWTRFERMTWYDLWHRRLGHAHNKFIKLSIEPSIGLEKLDGKKFSEHQKSPSFMIGKSQLNYKPESIKRAEIHCQRSHLQRWTLIWFHLLLPWLKDAITVLCSLMIALNIDGHMDSDWKPKDKLIDAVKQWYAEIANLRGKYQLLRPVVKKDFAGENMSHEIQEFFTDKGVKSYFSTPYKPWHDGLSEAGIKSVLLLARTEMTESGLAGRYWFSAVKHGKNCRNVTFKYRLGTTP